MLAVAEALMGAGTVAPAESTGGVYAIMPFDKAQQRKLDQGLHVDSHHESRERVSLVGYIGDVAPGGGGFSVWPGTHRRCWNLLRPSTDPLHQTNKGPEAAAKRKAAGGPFTARMKAEFAAIKAEVAPVDCHGRAGDVVFYHSRLGHHAGQNYSGNIRQAILTRLSKTEDSLPEAVLHQTDDMWLGWSNRVRAAAGAPAGEGPARL